MIVASRIGPPASGVRMPSAEAPTAVQINAGPSPRARMTREANSEPTSDPTPPAETTTPRISGGRWSSSMR